MQCFVNYLLKYIIIFMLTSLSHLDHSDQLSPFCNNFTWISRTKCISWIRWLMSCKSQEIHFFKNIGWFITICQRRLFFCLYCLSNILSYMKASNKIKDIFKIRFVRVLWKTPFIFTISVQISHKKTIFCARDNFAYTPFIWHIFRPHSAGVWFKIRAIKF